MLQHALVDAGISFLLAIFMKRHTGHLPLFACAMQIAAAIGGLSQFNAGFGVCRAWPVLRADASG